MHKIFGMTDFIPPPLLAAILTPPQFFSSSPFLSLNHLFFISPCPSPSSYPPLFPLLSSSCALFSYPLAYFLKSLLNYSPPFPSHPLSYPIFYPPVLSPNLLSPTLFSLSLFPSPLTPSPLFS